MTPKDKADYLVGSYKNILMAEDTECGQEILCTVIAIKCARAAIEQAISTLSDIGLTVAYFKAVLVELENYNA